MSSIFYYHFEYARNKGLEFSTSILKQLLELPTRITGESTFQISLSVYLEKRPDNHHLIEKKLGLFVNLYYDRNLQLKMGGERPIKKRHFNFKI